MHLVILLFALFASLFTLSKTGLNYSEPFFFIGSRMFFAGILLLGYERLICRRTYPMSWGQLKGIVLFGVLAIYVTNAAEIWGLQYMSSAKACLIYSLSPFAAAILAMRILKERLSFKKWLGLVIGFFGILPLLWAEAPTNELLNELGIIGWADVSLILAVFCSAYGWILLKKLLKSGQFSTLYVNGIAMLLGGTLALAHSYISGEHWHPVPVAAGGWPVFLECILWMTLISNIVCYNLYGYLLKKFSATFMAFAGLVTPLFASLFGWFFLDETITWHFYLAMSIFSIGLTLFYLEELPSFSVYKEDTVKQLTTS